MFALIALVPGTVIYAVSLQFVVRSIESWFDVRVDAALESGIAMGQNALDFLTSQIEDKGRDMAFSLTDMDPLTLPALNQLRERMGVDSVTVMQADGTVVARSEEHTSELQSPKDLVCRLLLEK